MVSRPAHRRPSPHAARRSPTPSRASFYSVFSSFARSFAAFIFTLFTIMSNENKFPLKKIEKTKYKAEGKKILGKGKCRAPTVNITHRRRRASRASLASLGLGAVGYGSGWVTGSCSPPLPPPPPPPAG